MENLAIEKNSTVEVKPNQIVISLGAKKFFVSYNSKLTNVKVKGEELEFSTVGKATKRKTATMRSIMAHVKNAFKGAANNFVKQLQVVYAHFPVSIEAKGKEVIIKNFLGEKLPRKAVIVGDDTKVEIKGQDITVTGSDKYSVGQTANNLTTATHIRKKDRRVFQDGIYPIIQ